MWSFIFRLIALKDKLVYCGEKINNKNSIFKQHVGVFSPKGSWMIIKLKDKMREKLWNPNAAKVRLFYRIKNKLDVLFFNIPDSVFELLAAVVFRGQNGLHSTSDGCGTREEGTWSGSWMSSMTELDVYICVGTMRDQINRLRVFCFFKKIKKAKATSKSFGCWAK